MSLFPACRAFVPAFLCGHGDMLVYLVPSLALAFLIRLLAATHPVFFIFTLAGTLCHELAHFCVGWLTGAAPTSLSVIPRRAGQHWQLGSVSLSRVRWYNAAPAALAPLLTILLPLGVAWWRTRGAWMFEPRDMALALLLAPQFLSCWPSPSDWRTAARSWPYLVIFAILGGLLFQIVRA